MVLSYIYIYIYISRHLLGVHIPLQGKEFRLFRPKIMGIPENYDDEAERVRTHPLLLPRPKETGVVPSADFQMLAKALGVKGKDNEESTPTVTPAQPERRNVLDNEKFGPGNRPYWEMKEGRAPHWYPYPINRFSAM